MKLLWRRRVRITAFVTFLVLCMTANVLAEYRGDNLPGFNWFNEQPEPKEDKQKQEKPQQDISKSQEEEFEDLPEYEKNIRTLQKKHEQAHRMALDNPTQENLLAELRLEKEMLRKSKIYAERRVAVAMLESEFTDMKGHSNVLHRKVQEQAESAEDSRNLKQLSKGWGLILQVAEECPHCHVFAPIVLEFANKYGFQLLAASKSGADFNGIEGVIDNGQMLVFNPARETPMLFLVKGDGKEVWPISRGIHSEMQIIINIKNIDKHIRRLFNVK